MRFIKIHIGIIDSQVWGHPGIFKIWIWLLLKANFKDGFSQVKTGIGHQSISVKRGQLLFGRDSASEELGINGSTIYKWLIKLEEWGNIKIESNSHNSLITITNYGIYQDIVTAMGQQHNSNITATEQQRNTSVECLEGKESKEVSTGDDFPNRYKTFIEMFNKITGRNFRGEKKSMGMLKSRLAEGFTPNEIKEAIEKCHADPYHIENPKYLTPEFILRSDKLQKYYQAPLKNAEITLAEKLANPTKYGQTVIKREDVYGK